LPHTRQRSVLVLTLQKKEGRKKLPAISLAVRSMSLCVQLTPSPGGRRTLRNHRQWRK
jgi:hypothetical protein